MHMCLVCISSNKCFCEYQSLGFKNGDAVTVAAPYCFGMKDSPSMGKFEYMPKKNNLTSKFETARRSGGEVQQSVKTN